MYGLVACCRTARAWQMPCLLPPSFHSASLHALQWPQRGAWLASRAGARLFPHARAPGAAGKPLKGEDHGAQFYRVDPLMQAMTRTMGAQNLRLLSLELRDELAAAVASLRQQLHHELRAALEVERQQQRQRPKGAREGSNIKETHAAGASGGSSGSGGSWVSRLLGLGESAAAGGSSAGSSSRHTVEAIREGRHPCLQHAADEVAKLVRLYNSAVLADKETLGSHWPLNQSKQLEWEEEVASALAELK